MPDLQRTAKVLGLPLLLGALLLSGGCSSELHPREGLSSGGDVRFSDRDREVIREFYSLYPYPPGLARPDIIAPEPQERIEGSAVLPSGLAAMPLPAALAEQLSRLPPGYIRFRAGDDVVLMDSRTREVKDIIRDVLHPPPKNNP